VLGLLALALSVSGFFVFRFAQPVLAGVSLGLSIRVLRRIRRGEAPRRARPWAWATLALAVFNVLVFLLGLGLVLTFLFLARHAGD
jgi:uncharacterized membrane-anchored protein